MTLSDKFNIDISKDGKNRRKTIRDKAYDEAIRAGIRRETIISCLLFENLPQNDKQILNGILSKYLKDY